MSDVLVTVEPEGRKIRSKEGVILLDALAASGVSVRSECGGRGACGKCKVFVTEKTRINEVTDQEKLVLTREETAHNMRLACQVRIEGNLTVMIPVKSRVRQRRIQVAGVDVALELSPAVQKLRAQPSLPSLLDTKTYSELLLSFLEETYDLQGLTIGYEALKKLPKALNASQRDVTATVWNSLEVIDVEAGDTTQQVYGLAVDIGTSKIVGQLVSLGDGQVVATSS
ncbi:MAG: 2Fe-2S iron-sulfur cluster-binding protein, partial [Candidatus Bathyarchaeia archaeon]